MLEAEVLGTRESLSSDLQAVQAELRAARDDFAARSSPYRTAGI